MSPFDKVTPRVSMMLLSFFDGVYVPDRFDAGQLATIKSYRVDVNLFNKWMMSQEQRVARVEDLTDTNLKAAMAWLRGQGRALATANRFYRTLKALHGLAYQIELLEKPLRTKQFKENRREPEAWLPDEIEAIIRTATKQTGTIGVDHVPANVWGPSLLLFILSTGVRISAAMATPTSRLDLQRGEVLIRAETQKQRADQRFQLLPSAVGYLRKLDAHGRGLVRVFDDWPSDRGVESWPYLNRWLRKIICAAGLRKRRKDCTRTDLFHKLRKTFATQVASRSGLPTACAMLGHSSMDVTKRYIDKRQMSSPDIRELLTDPLAERPTRIAKAGRRPPRDEPAVDRTWREPVDVDVEDDEPTAGSGVIDCGW